MTRSWVEETCPPGWAIRQIGESDSHQVSGPHDVTIWVTREAGCRAAWERWALQVLGGRVKWVDGKQSTRAVLCTDAGNLILDEESDHSCWWVYGHTDGAWASRRAPRCTDPVEALARLADAGRARPGGGEVSRPPRKIKAAMKAAPYASAPSRTSRPAYKAL